MFRNGFAFNKDISAWNVSSVTNMRQMFDNANAFNQTLNTWDVSNVTSMNEVFKNNIIFNQPLNNWDTSSAITMSGMFQDATAFDQNLSSWNITSLNLTITLNNFLFNGTLSTSNYDALLIGWSAQTPLLNGLAPNFGNSQYTLGGAAESARNTLINTYGWTITDGGGI